VWGCSAIPALQLASGREQALANISSIGALVEACNSAPASPLEVPELPSLALGSPRIRAKVGEEPATRIGKMEGPRGQPFSFPFERGNAVQNQVRLAGIGMEAGTRVDKLRLETPQGVLVCNGDQGDKQHPVDWRPGPGQVVLGFSGRSDDDPKGAVYALQAVVARIEGIDWAATDALVLDDI
jgi:hypothetical protein